MSIIHIPGLNFCSWIIIFYQKIRSRGYRSIVISDHTPTSLEPLLARLPVENSLIHRSLCSLIRMMTWNHTMGNLESIYPGANDIICLNLREGSKGGVRGDLCASLLPLLFIKNSFSLSPNLIYRPQVNHRDSRWTKASAKGLKCKCKTPTQLFLVKQRFLESGQKVGRSSAHQPPYPDGSLGSNPCQM